MKKLNKAVLWAYRLVFGSPFVTGMLKAFLANRRDTFWWAVSTLVGGLMPLWTALFLRRLYSESFKFSEFAAHGDLALYSAAFLAPAIYHAAASARRQRSLLQSGTVTLASIALVFSAILFTAVNPELTSLATQGGVAPSPRMVSHLDLRFLLHTSWALLIFSFLVALCVFLNDAYQDFPDPSSAERVDQFVLSGAMALQGAQTALNLAVPDDVAAGTSIESQEDLAKQFTADGGAER